MASKLVRDLIWKKAAEARRRRRRRRNRLFRFPNTLWKRVRSHGRSWITGIRGYYYYPVDEVQQWILSQLPLALKRHRVLPIPEIQHDDLTCLFYAVILVLEARLRIAQWRVDPSEDIPRLSVQHPLDLLFHLDDSDAIFNFLGLEYVTRLHLAADQVGVTTAANYPYRPGAAPDPLRVPLPREVMHWERFKLRNITTIQDESYNGTNETLIDCLTENMVEDGPFIGWYDMYSTHTPHTILERKGTLLVTDEGEVMVHTVALTGFKKWRSHGKMEGYWEFVNSGGLAWGRNGFRRIAFDAIKGVEIFTPSLL